jgi:hypothetical protein
MEMGGFDAIQGMGREPSTAGLPLPAGARSLGWVGLGVYTL